LENGRDGAVRRYGKITPEVEEADGLRVGHHPPKKHSRTYFLVVEDNRFAAPRAPADEARLAASIGLVTVWGSPTSNPLKHNLYFERFLEPQPQGPARRRTIDFPWDERDDIFSITSFEKYGPAPRGDGVQTNVRLQYASAVRECGEGHWASFFPSPPDHRRDGKNWFPFPSEVVPGGPGDKVFATGRRFDRPGRDNLSVIPAASSSSPDDLRNYVPLQPAAERA
jgi:hypothetical protein